VNPDPLRLWLEQIEGDLARGETDAVAALTLVAAQTVDLEDDELHAARRRALLLLAAGGDPHRGLDLDGRAVTALAADLETEERLAQLDLGLRHTPAAGEGLPAVEAVLEGLRADPARAWRWFACGLLAEELGSE
jgi:hypothetical protein